MYFDSLDALFYMNGHGAYVWSVYAIASAIIAALALGPLRKRRRFVREETRRMQREGKR
jgi:heme exporter protein D